MAHSCPICDSLCHCGGDIDDIQLNGTDEEDNCTHCDEDDIEDDDDINECEFCGRCHGAHAGNCPRHPSPFYELINNGYD